MGCRKTPPERKKMLENIPEKGVGLGLTSITALVCFCLLEGKRGTGISRCWSGVGKCEAIHQPTTTTTTTSDPAGLQQQLPSSPFLRFWGAWEDLFGRCGMGRSGTWCNQTNNVGHVVVSVLRGSPLCWGLWCSCPQRRRF